MPLDLYRPIDPDSPDWQRALSMLQGNIIRSHGRDHTALLLIEFRPGQHLRNRVGAFAGSRVTSAADQTEQAVRYRERQRSTTAPDQQLFGGFFLSVWGYLALGYSRPELVKAFPDAPGDFAARVEPSFTNWLLHGMEYHGSQLLDPPILWWEPEYRAHIDAMLLLACDDEQALARAVIQAVNDVSTFGSVRKVETGRTYRRGKTALEHFGYADGISQPRFLKGEPDPQRPGIVFQRDFLAGEPDALGSYLVYRKLEENIKAFHAEEKRLADHLGLTDCARQRAGAMIVGRFRDGSPLVKSACPTSPPQPDNDFDYSDDPSGAKCPLHAHIRKVRPRNSSRPQMVRRGVPYGPYDPTDATMEHPETGSGLLFLSHQLDIHDQFGMVQQDWANKVDFPSGTAAGPDPLAGQGLRSHEQQWPVRWGDTETRPLRLSSFVTMKGGEFFFAPSKAYFRRLSIGY